MIGRKGLLERKWELPLFWGRQRRGLCITGSAHCFLDLGGSRTHCGLLSMEHGDRAHHVEENRNWNANVLWAFRIRSQTTHLILPSYLCFSVILDCRVVLSTWHGLALALLLRKRHLSSLKIELLRGMASSQGGWEFKSSHVTQKPQGRVEYFSVTALEKFC